jgi:hypothetical protein
MMRGIETRVLPLPLDVVAVAVVVAVCLCSLGLARLTMAADQDSQAVAEPTDGGASSDNDESDDGDESDDSSDKPVQKSRRELLRERRARLQEEREAAQEAIRQKWLARLEARGIEPWEPPSEEAHATALEKYKLLGEEVRAQLPGVGLYETEHFLFYSNIPPPQLAPYVRYLDAMYAMMARLFGIPEEQPVWLGRKAPVFAFLNRGEFIAFEERYFKNRAASGVYGICHQAGDGQVIIACYRGEDPHDFGQMLVHETSHGFVFRYKTKASLPVWVDEGLAEYIGEQMVPASDSVRNKEEAAVIYLKQTPSLGANFFVADAQLEAWQYGAATRMNKLMMSRGRDRYVAFIEGLKEGLSWQESLREAYNASPEELVLLYGRSIGVPALGL